MWESLKNGWKREFSRRGAKFKTQGAKKIKVKRKEPSRICEKPFAPLREINNQ